MSTQVFPTLSAQTFPAKRSPSWKTQLFEAISGKRTGTRRWSYPRWEWELGFDGLRQGTRSLGTFAEFAQLAGFFNIVYGRGDTFLYSDRDDNAAIGAALGNGDGATLSFQLARAFGGFVEPIFAPNLVSKVYVNGVAQAGGSYAVNAWGTASPGTIVFNAAPGAGLAITADFTFYFPCRFLADRLDFEMFMATLYSGKSVKFDSEK